MAIREGSLEAPTRHPIDWQSDAFWDRENLEQEMERIFDILDFFTVLVLTSSTFSGILFIIRLRSAIELPGMIFFLLLKNNRGAPKDPLVK